jgi:hypothetical protein
MFSIDGSYNQSTNDLGDVYNTGGVFLKYEQGGFKAALGLSPGNPNLTLEYTTIFK